MSIESIIISANPVLKWESFSLSLSRKHILKPNPKFRDIGWCHSLTFYISPDRMTRALSDDLLANGGMRQVRQYNEHGDLEWGGYIHRVREDTGTTISELNLDNVFNRQWCRYNTSTDIERSTKFNDTESQARVGIRERAIVAGDVSLDIADQHIQSIMAWTSFPSPGVRQIDFGGDVKDVPTIEITALGWYHALKVRTYNQTANSGEASVTTIVTDIVNEVGQFVRNSYIEDNVSQLNQEMDNDRTADLILNSIAEVGDSGFNRWVWGVGANMDFFFRQAARPVR